MGTIVTGVWQGTAIADSYVANDITLTNITQITTRSHTSLTDIGSNAHSVIDTHIGDGTKHFLEGAIDHANILSIGSNAHSVIDTHLGAANPHSGSAPDAHSHLDAEVDNGITLTNITQITTRSHTSLTDIGTNAHSVIDTHIAAANPHAGSAPSAHSHLDAEVDNGITLTNITQITTRSHTSLSDIGTNAHSVIDTHIGAANPHTGHVDTTGNETIAGIKTFSSFPITPSSAPTTNYQVANKKYVDDEAGGTDYDSDLMIGSGNSAYVPLIPIGGNDSYPSTVRIAWSLANIAMFTNVGSADPGLYLELPIPTSRGGKSLYTNNLKLGLFDSDSNDRVYSIILYGITQNDTVLIVNDDNGGAHFYNGAANDLDGGVEALFTQGWTGGPYDLSGYDRIVALINCETTSANALDIAFLNIGCYYV